MFLTKSNADDLSHFIRPLNYSKSYPQALLLNATLRVVSWPPGGAMVRYYRVDAAGEILRARKLTVSGGPTYHNTTDLRVLEVDFGFHCSFTSMLQQLLLSDHAMNINMIN